MTTTQTLVVPPVYEAMLLGAGASAVKIGVRKVYTCDAMLRTMKSRTYKHAHNVAAMSFGQLVAFVNAGE